MSFNGKYQRQSHQNLDKFLDYVQMNDPELRKQALDTFPIVEVSLMPGTRLIYLKNKGSTTFVSRKFVL